LSGNAEIEQIRAEDLSGDYPVSPRGVRRFRIIEEANAGRDRWVGARVEPFKLASRSSDERSRLT